MMNTKNGGKKMRAQNNMMILSILVVLVLAACAPAQETADGKTDGKKLNIVTTIGMITDIVGNVGGEHVKVTGLMGPGVDPHLYKASEGDVSALAGADLIFFNGLHLEAGMGGVIERMESQTKVKAVSDDIPREELLDFPGYPGQYDPHIWFDVNNWISAVKVVRDTLKEVDPGNAEEYEANAAAYLEKLTKLNSDIKEKIESVPEQQRVLITAHDAFQYFGRAYNFKVNGLQGISTQSEAGTRDVQDLAQFIADNEIKAIFVESSIPRRNVEAVQAAVKAKGWDVAIGGELFSDAMGDKSTFEGTYIGMVTHNVDTITSALR